MKVASHWWEALNGSGGWGMGLGWNGGEKLRRGRGRKQPIGSMPYEDAFAVDFRVYCGALHM